MEDLNIENRGSVYQLRFWHHVILCAALFATEIAVTYELIYMVVLGRALGLRLSQVTIPGVISASTALVLCPLMGRFGDKGNRYRRKIFLVISSGLMQAAGAAVLLAACFLQISMKDNKEIEAENQYKDCKRSFLLRTESLLNASDIQGKYETDTTNATVKDMYEGGSLGDSISILCKSIASPNITGADNTDTDSHGWPTPAALGVLAFVLMDVGFDTGTSNIRAFLVECVIPQWHSDVLTVGVLMSGLGGAAFALMGLPDYAAAYGQTRHELYYKSISLSIFLFAAVLATFPTTLLFGAWIRSKSDFNRINDGDGDGTSGIANNNTNMTPVDISKESVNTTYESANGPTQAYSEAENGMRSSQRLKRYASGLYTNLTSNMKTYLFKALFLLCFTTFLAGSLPITFEVFFSNFLAEGVFGGDADAPSAGEAGRRFQEGMKEASIGTFVFQAMFFVYNLVHPKVSSKIGLITEYILCSAVIIPMIVALCLSKNLPVFYVVTVLEGVYRTLFFTTPFVLATEILKEDVEKAPLLANDTLASPKDSFNDNDKDNDKGEELAHGLTISVVYAMVPCSYLVILPSWDLFLTPPTTQRLLFTMAP